MLLYFFSMSSNSGTDFSNGDYIIEKTADLIAGNTRRYGRESLGGWFSFNWDDSVCVGQQTLFRYHNGELIRTVSIDNACIVFTGKSHIIKVGNWDRPLNQYSEFSGYNSEFSGTKDTSPYYHIYAGEEANYKMYILYKEGGKETPYPILLDAEIYIGEPPEIDFDIFREVVENEEDSPVTFRNPIIKTWYDNRDNWYKHLYDCGELSYDQIWYVKKTMFFIFESAIPGSDTYDEMDENYPSKRNLYLNTYYSPEVGSVVPTINGNVGSVMENVMPGNVYEIKITGSTSDGQTVQAPSVAGDKFRIPIIYKPYYYNAVIWEGYSVFENTTVGEFKGYAMGHAVGTIYNGVTYDYLDNGTTKTVFGRTVLNEARDLTNVVNQNVTTMADSEMTSTRTTSFEYDALESGGTYTRFEGAESSLLITEGSPDIIESTYVPAEYRITTTSVGSPSNWNVILEIVYSGSSQFVQKMRISTYNEYETLNGYVFSGFVPEMYRNVEITSSTPIPAYQSTDEYGDSITEFLVNYTYGQTNVIICEGLKHDELIYDSNTSQMKLGYLKSRNIIRHGFTQNYIKRSAMEFIIQHTSLTDGTDVIEKMKINVGIDANLQANKFWQNIEDIIVSRGGITMKLLSEFGYGIEYTDDDGAEKIVVSVTDVYVDEEGRKTAPFIPDDAFTRIALAQGQNNWNADVTLVCGGIGSVIPPSEGSFGCNNTINQVKFENQSCWFIYGSFD